MTMHLVGPALSLNGKKRGKKKFRNAEEARKARELAADWDKLKQKWAVPAREKKVGKIRESLQSSGYRLSTPPGRETENYPSVSTPGHSTAKVEKVYTGDKVLGIATMHKSNAVPVFRAEDAVEISKMRRG